MIIKKSVLSSSIERTRERENERDDLKEENFLASGKKVNF